jgi:hypothetical protein
MILEMTLEEVNGLLGLIDAAVKAQGLNVARNAIYFQDKMLKAHEDEKKTGLRVVSDVPMNSDSGTQSMTAG